MILKNAKHWAIRLVFHRLFPIAYIIGAVALLVTLILSLGPLQ